MTAVPPRAPAAVVTGLESIAGLQSARILHRRGVAVIGVCADPRAPFRRTRACRRIVKTRPDELAETLAILGPELEGRAVIVPSTDGEVLQLLRHRAELSRWFHIALPPGDVTEQLMDKARFIEFALANELPIPRTEFLDGRRNAASLGSQLRYPAVIKPTMRDGRWTANSKPKAFKVADPAQFMSVYDRASQWTDSLIAQEWIEGGEDRLYSCNAYFDRRSEPLVTFVSRKVRQWPPETGMSALAVECRNDDVRDTAIRLFQRARFHGLAYLEMKYDVRDGRHYIIEPNVGRATGRSAIAEAGGVDLLLTMYCDLVGLPLPSTREQRYTGAKWMYLRWDLQAAQAAIRRGDLTLRQWWRSLQGQRTYAALDVRDPLPFLLDFTRTFTRRLRRSTPGSGPQAASPAAPTAEGHGTHVPRA